MSTLPQNLLSIQIKKKEMLFARMQELYDLSLKMARDPTRSQTFIAAARNASKIREEFIAALDRCQELSFDIKSDYVPSYQEVGAIEELYAAVNHTLAVLLSVQSHSPNGNEKGAKGGHAVGAKLETVRLPIFSGKLEEFPTFIQLFTTMVDANPAYTDVERVSHLLSHLSDSAKMHCSSIPPTAENYKLILNALKNRFEDQRALSSAYLDKILNFKALTTESEQSLDNFLSHFVEPVNALKQMKLDDLADLLFLHVGLKKLDFNTARAFENSKRSEKEIPKFESLVSFVTEQAKILSRSGGYKLPTYGKPQNAVQQKPKNSHINYSMLARESSAPVHPHSAPGPSRFPSSSQKCQLCQCSHEHPLYECVPFKRMLVQDRWAFVRKRGACKNCLSLIHQSQDCKSSSSCRIEGCGQRHHSLLHRPLVKPPPSSAVKSQFTTGQPPQDSGSGFPPPGNAFPSAPTQSFCSVNSPAGSFPPSTVLLATVKVIARDSQGELHELRGIADPGSMTSFLCRKVCNKLGLQLTPTQSVVKGIGTSPLNISACANFTFSSRINPAHDYSAHVLVVDRLADRIPTMAVRIENLAHLKGLALADTEFNEPGEIDFLLGCDLWANVVGSKKIVGQVDEPVAIETTLGYVVMGRAAVDSSAGAAVCLFVQDSLDTLVKKFWSLEEVPVRRLLSPDEVKCEELFNSSYSRDDEGRFTVRLPFRLPPEMLGSSLSVAASRFRSLERKFSRDSALAVSYGKMIKEYETDGTLSRVCSIQEVGNELAYYMPHHGVHRPNHPTTPLRIVFNASAATSSSYSLNQLMFVGPKLQADIFEVLIHFRLFQFAITADIRRMFLQINVAKEDRRFQRLVWRSDPAEPLQVFELNKVVFGNASSPYLANRVVKQLAALERARFPMAAAVADRDVYVDDVASSVDTYNELTELHRQLGEMFASGGFTLSKWASNSAKLISTISPESRLMSDVDFDHDTPSKVLGVQWSPRQDHFSCVVDLPDLPCTKRNILSVTARIFDPLGLVAPVTLTAKLLIHRLWREGCGWDETPANSVVQEWEGYKRALPLLRNVSVGRHVGVVSGSVATLVGFADSSTKAYGACIYVHTANSGQSPTVKLLCAKSRVAPQKGLTIPRLELCAALLLSNLMKTVLNAYTPRYQFKNVVAFTDSKVVLCWIQSDPSRWKIFVGNRIAQIHENLAQEHWRHIAGEDNPADVLSRGIKPSGLLEHPLWFSGPPWLQRELEDWPISVEQVAELPEAEERPAIPVFLAVKPPESVLAVLLDRVSSFRKLLRATAYVFRFCNRKNLGLPFVSAEELDGALKFWVVYVQRDSYGAEIANLDRGAAISNWLNHLDPFLSEGVLRVGGRLQNAAFPYEQQHPILLPSKGKFVELLIDQYHIDLLHAGPHVLLANLRLKYWIPAARTMVRSRVHKCNTCYRTRPKPVLPKMAPLPQFRVTGNQVFERVGVDYAGPFHITPLRRRGQRTLTKAYFCLFICLAVKAVHIELVSDLSTEMFLAAFKRFLSRRGPCRFILSDGGTNFIGARRRLSELDDLVGSSSFDKSMGTELAAHGIEWKINPPNGPWFGGIWESNIKTVKGHLQRIIGNQILTYEEFNTTLVQIEAIMNSRPLCVLNSDPSSPTALTPAHFLTVGASLDRLPTENVQDIPVNRLQRYQLMDRIVQEYWARWRQEYLHTLQARSKWTQDATPIEEGTVVVLMKDNVPTLSWPLGVIERCHYGRDGVARVVDVRTHTGTYRRPVGRVCPLPTQ
ncbi:Pao retrotransposon peptidase [Nesidiocoris tenuis]|uniref:Pao retrotransposon peptidase n=1 Tax=Nesidiocoris tenuis TaxID=355587 RepID=A0ABN7BAM1_9HEMI|nr:Pao retrotransposon peptidase [Nesidiocoris tenuis]